MKHYSEKQKQGNFFSDAISWAQEFFTLETHKVEVRIGERAVPLEDLKSHLSEDVISRIQKDLKENGINVRF